MAVDVQKLTTTVNVRKALREADEVIEQAAASIRKMADHLRDLGVRLTNLETFQPSARRPADPSAADLIAKLEAIAAGADSDVVRAAITETIVKVTHARS